MSTYFAIFSVLQPILKFSFSFLLIKFSIYSSWLFTFPKCNSFAISSVTFIGLMWNISMNVVSPMVCCNVWCSLQSDMIYIPVWFIFVRLRPIPTVLKREQCQHRVLPQITHSFFFKHSICFGNQSGMLSHVLV